VPVKTRWETPKLAKFCQRTLTPVKVCQERPTLAEAHWKTPTPAEVRQKTLTLAETGWKIPTPVETQCWVDLDLDRSVSNLGLPGLVGINWVMDSLTWVGFGCGRS